jgi:hypothetical protein
MDGKALEQTLARHDAEDRLARYESVRKCLGVLRPIVADPCRIHLTTRKERGAVADAIKAALVELSRTEETLRASLLGRGDGPGIPTRIREDKEERVPQEVTRANARAVREVVARKQSEEELAAYKTRLEHIARLVPYGNGPDQLEPNGEDATECVNWMIRSARSTLKRFERAESGKAR